MTTYGHTVTDTCDSCGATFNLDQLKRGRDGQMVCPSCMAGPNHDGAEAATIRDRKHARRHPRHIVEE